MQMIFGVDYYPEHWNKSEWEAQAALMEAAHFNTVRMAEFAWKIMERREGEYDFSLFDTAIGILAGHGIKTILGTPTAAPPKWLIDNYDVLQRDKYLRKEEWGSRRECCANSPDYMEKSAKIVEKMAEHYRDNPNVIGWQIDNEFGCHGSTRCFCEHCRRAFAEWLRGRYTSVEELNEKWGSAFWSLNYDSFDEVILPAYSSCDSPYGENRNHNPGLELDYDRFASESWVRYQKMQTDIIRKYSKAPITHNFMGHFSDIDYNRLADDLDFVSWDNYPDTQWGGSDYEYVAMAHEIMYGNKNKNFVVMEEQAGPAGWDRVGMTPRPGQLKLWAYQAIAHGAEGIVFFRFRTALFGMEQYWYGVLDHDGVPRRRYYEIQKLGEELENLAPYIIGAENKKEVLLVKSYENLWSHDIKCHTSGYNHENHLYSYYKAYADLNINVAVGDGWDRVKKQNESMGKIGNIEDIEDMGDAENIEDAENTGNIGTCWAQEQICSVKEQYGSVRTGMSCEVLNQYKIVCMPAYNVVNDTDVAALEEYVRGGGTLVLTYRSGTRDMYNRMRPIAVPGVFRELAGIEVTEFDAVRRPVGVIGNFSATAKLWCDIIEPDTADVLAVYDSEYYKGKAAITVNSFGAGKVFYVGCDLDESAMLNLAEYIARSAGVMPIKAPSGVEIVKRENYTVILNHNEEPAKIQYGIGAKRIGVACGGEFDGKVNGYGVEFIEG